MLERPPFYTCDEPNSFAALTFQKRLPGILERLMADWKEDEGLHEGVGALLEELKQDVEISTLPNNCDGIQTGVRWSQLPFLHAEVYLYNRVLQVFEYETRGLDPFLSQKKQAKEACANARAQLEEEDTEELDMAQYLLHSFYGNKTDLSLHSLKESQIELGGVEELILVNQIPEIVRYLESCEEVTQLDIIVDNYCFELFNDLRLGQKLQRQYPKAVISIHCKAFPIFVSDAIPADVAEMCVEMNVQNIEICSDTYWNSPSEWFERMPASLSDHFARADLVIVKGDANYRKLVGARKYDETVTFEETVDYFPSKAVCAIRGLKCELCVGVPAEVRAEQAKQSPTWNVDGTRGVIQFHAKK
jgi:uncharacterized protein with ATP-grasp and redox domains